MFESGDLIYFSKKVNCKCPECLKIKTNTMSDFGKNPPKKSRIVVCLTARSTFEIFLVNKSISNVSQNGCSRLLPWAQPFWDTLLTKSFLWKVDRLTSALTTLNEECHTTAQTKIHIFRTKEEYCINYVKYCF